jgi:hypothetical protein
MDLGIRGRTAIVCAASRGLGRAIAIALAHEGVNLVINARSEAALATLAGDLWRETGVSVTTVAADHCAKALASQLPNGSPLMTRSFCAKPLGMIEIICVMSRTDYRPGGVRFPKSGGRST